MHIQFALFADAANVSQEGKLNVLGVFDALQVAQLPALHPRATFVMRCKALPADEGHHEMALAWVNPESKALWTTTGTLQVGTAPDGTGEIDLPLIAQIDLPLDVAGLYEMRVALDGEEVARVPLTVALPIMPGTFPLAPQPTGLVA